LPASKDASQPAARLLLAVDCATAPPSIALLRGTRTLLERRQSDQRRTDAWIGAALDACLQESGVEPADLDGLAVTVGPGTFTGVRVGIAICLGLAAPRKLPVAGVQTLEALAEAWSGEARLIAACVDARRGQVYGAVYRPRPDQALPLSPCWGPAVDAPSAFAAALEGFDEDLLLAGSGAALIDAGDAVRRPGETRPLAAAAGRLAARGWPADAEAPEWPAAEPLYLRPADAEPPKNPLLDRR
jgi:tRNA threonylcarbamoyladenosine biosynthesis protein TsaB